MQCLVCGGEMRVELVVRDRTMPVAGFAHQTFSCVACGETEQRLAFAPERPATREGARTAQTQPTPAPALDPPRDPPLGPPLDPPLAPERERGAWTQAIERIRLHQAMLAQRAASATALPPVEPTQGAGTTDAEVTVAAAIAPAPAAPSALTTDEFDRLWDSLARPLPVPVPSEPPAITQASTHDSAPERPLDLAPVTAPPIETTTPVMITPLETPPVMITPVETPAIMITPVETPPITSLRETLPMAAAAIADAPTAPTTAPMLVASAPAPSPADGPTVATIARVVAASAWARAVSKLRSRMPQSDDTILRVGGQDIPQISDEALRLPHRRSARRA